MTAQQPPESVSPVTVPAPGAAPAVEMRGINVSFGGVRAVD